MSFPRLVFHNPRHARLLSTTPLPPTRSRRLLYTTTFILAGALGALTHAYNPAPPARLNPHTFTAYTLTTHTPISSSPPSPTALLTLSLPPGTAPSSPSPSALESLEIKNPHIQIARSYTPLPACGGGGGDSGEITLLVKREPGGEMTRYLFSLRPGTAVELRGPHTEYVLPLPGSPTKLLFLAGGTGIAPALQCAQKLLAASPGAEMRVLWAVRDKREAGGVIEEEVGRLKREFGERLGVKVVSDGEGGIRRDVVKDAVEWGAGRVIVSGPEGFVSYWAGPKGDWVGGKEQQGRLGGLIGEILEGRRDVKVWKL